MQLGPVVQVRHALPVLATPGERRRDLQFAHRAQQRAARREHHRKHTPLRRAPRVASRAFPAAHCAPKQPAARAERGHAAVVELLPPATRTEANLGKPRQTVVGSQLHVKLALWQYLTSLNRMPQAHGGRPEAHETLERHEAKSQH